MTDTVASSAIITGALDTVRGQETALMPLFGGPLAAAATCDLDAALAAAADAPTLGCVAVVELCRAKAGWRAQLGASNGSVRYEAFARALRDSGWFRELRRAGPPALPAFDADNSQGSIQAIVGAAFPGLTAEDRRHLAGALIGSLAQVLGPQGAAPEPPEEADHSGLLGKAEVLERRVTTIASHAMTAGDTPRFDMHWRTETFLRTKEGKDKPKETRGGSESNHSFVFDVARWRVGDRSALLEYYQRIDDWAAEMNTSGGIRRAMTCFANEVAGSSVSPASPPDPRHIAAG